MILEIQESVQGREFEKRPRECEHGAMRDAVKTVHPAAGDSRTNGLRSQGGKRASAAGKVLSAKHAEDNPPSCISNATAHGGDERSLP